MRPCGWRLSLSCSKQQRAQDRFQHIASGEHWSVAMDRSGNHNLSVEFKFLCRCRTVSRSEFRKVRSPTGSQILVIWQGFALGCTCPAPARPPLQELGLVLCVGAREDVALGRLVVEAPAAVWALHQAGVGRTGDRRGERIPSRDGGVDLPHVLHCRPQGLGLQ